MITALINKLLFIVFFMSVLNILRHSTEIVRRLMFEDTPEKYIISNKERIILGLSIAYFLTTIFTGITT
jgi:hypothetical protein